MNVGTCVTVKTYDPPERVISTTGWFDLEEIKDDVDRHYTRGDWWFSTHQLVTGECGISLGDIEYKGITYVRVLFTSGRIMLVASNDLEIHS